MLSLSVVLLEGAAVSAKTKDYYVLASTIAVSWMGRLKRRDDVKLPSVFIIPPLG